MTDRELLELAAKAAGIEGVYKEMRLVHGDVSGISAPTHSLWNPLTDDGDALRLAVKLEIDIALREKLTLASYRTNSSEWVSFVEDHVEDVFARKCPYAATRRAIVRAAAEIGKGMK